MEQEQAQPVQREVLVVGAGPVGLVSALALRAKGRTVTVLESEPEGRKRPGSRAIFIHKESLKIIEQMRPGLGLEIASHGLVWPTKRTFWGKKEVFVKHYPTPEPGVLPPFSSLPQVEIERYFSQACLDAGVEFIWNANVTKVETTSESVTVKTDDDRVWTSYYLIAADGSRSMVRRSLNIPMEGSRSTNSYIVVDVAEDQENPLPPERIFRYNHPALKKNVLFVPFVGGWRVDLQLDDDDNPEGYSGEEGVRKWLTKVMPAKYADRITWVSTYQFLQIVAREFVDEHRRVLLVGEAGHLFAPFGARGMNSGIADAEAAVEAIDKAFEATDPESARAAIDEFATARLAAARYNRDAANQALIHIQGKSPVMWVRRRVAALLAPRSEKAGIWLDSGPYGPRLGQSGQASSKY